MWAVFRKDLRLFLRDRSALLFSLVMPILVITIIAEASSTTTRTTAAG
jgi:ABC-type transport system involved in cytochrome c biogenesis permease component